MGTVDSEKALGTTLPDTPKRPNMPPMPAGAGGAVQGPSTFDKAKMGAMMGGSVGIIIGFIFAATVYGRISSDVWLLHVNRHNHPDRELSDRHRNLQKITGPTWQADDHAPGPLQEVAVSYALNESGCCSRRNCTDMRGHSAQRI